jgi:antirestriction protein ArdC
MIEATRPWSKSWNGSTAPNIPLRSWRSLSGINVLTLWVASMTKGYASPHWLTFKQALALGDASARARRHTVVYANKIEAEADGASVAAKGRGRQASGGVPQALHVFNAEQIDGEAKPPRANRRDQSDERDADARLCPRARHRSASVCQPYYRRAATCRHARAHGFHTSDDYSTLRTSYPRSHVDRLAVRPSFRREDYAREELVALSGQSAPPATLQ